MKNKRSNKRSKAIKMGDGLFSGLMNWMGMIAYLKQNKITSYAVKQDITTVEVKDHVIIVPPHLERIISELIKESTQ